MTVSITSHTRLEIPCSKQAQYLKFKWLQRDWNPQPVSSQTNTQHLAEQAGQMVELCCEHLSVCSTDCVFLSCHIHI